MEAFLYKFWSTETTQVPEASYQLAWVFEPESQLFLFL